MKVNSKFYHYELLFERIIANIAISLIFVATEQRKLKRLKREVGPPWYYELSNAQRIILGELKSNIHQDLLEDIPARTRKSLSDLGITLRIPTSVLMSAMNDSVEDPGVFIWNLYSAYYKKPPSELRSGNAM